jgi:hypothetical protein
MKRSMQMHFLDMSSRKAEPNMMEKAFICVRQEWMLNVDDSYLSIRDNALSYRVGFLHQYMGY